MKTFNRWLEEFNAGHIAAKETLLAYFRQKLNIKDDQAILDMPLDEMDDAVVDGLLDLGEMRTASPEAIQRIRNHGGTVAELADLMGG